MRYPKSYVIPFEGIDYYTRRPLQILERRPKTPLDEKWIDAIVKLGPTASFTVNVIELLSGWFNSHMIRITIQLARQTSRSLEYHQYAFYTHRDIRKTLDKMIAGL